MHQVNILHVYRLLLCYRSLPCASVLCVFVYVTGNPGRTYKYYTGTPVLPFGYGLSYSNFSLVQQSIGTERQAQAKPLPRYHIHCNKDGKNSVAIQIKMLNTGNVASRTTSLLFASPIHTNSDLKKKLVAFQSTPTLQPQEEATQHFTIKRHDLIPILASSTGEEESNLWDLHINDYHIGTVEVSTC